jgi:hypothetical protein
MPFCSVRATGYRGVLPGFGTCGSENSCAILDSRSGVCAEATVGEQVIGRNGVG